MKRTRRITAMALVLVLAMGFACAAYGESMLPVVTIQAESLEDWWGKGDVRNAVLTYRDFSTGIQFVRNITIKPQGSSSLAYDKKNFTIQMTEEGVEMRPEWGAQSKYCLKANYIDPTQAGNVVSARLAAEMNEAYGLFDGAPNHGVIDGFPVWIILNGQDAGLYTWNIPKAAWMFGMDEENENHIVMCCEGWTPSCKMQTDSYTIGEDWELEVGQNTSATVEKFVRVLRFVSTSSDDEFRADFDQYLNLDACLNYYCYVCITAGVDNIGKNMLMTTLDGQVWSPVLYDLDSLWGVSWDGKSISAGNSIDVYYSDNRLFERLRALFGNELRARYAELRNGIFSREHIQTAFYDFADGIPQSAYAMDRQMWNADGSLIRTLDMMWELIDLYLPKMDYRFGYESQEMPYSAAGDSATGQIEGEIE